MEPPLSLTCLEFASAKAERPIAARPDYDLIQSFAKFLAVDDHPEDRHSFEEAVKICATFQIPFTHLREVSGPHLFEKGTIVATDAPGGDLQLWVVEEIDAEGNVVVWTAPSFRESITLSPDHFDDEVSGAILWT